MVHPPCGAGLCSPSSSLTGELGGVCGSGGLFSRSSLSSSRFSADAQNARERVKSCEPRAPAPPHHPPPRQPGQPALPWSHLREGTGRSPSEAPTASVHGFSQSPSQRAGRKPTRTGMWLCISGRQSCLCAVLNRDPRPAPQ